MRYFFFFVNVPIRKMKIQMITCERHLADDIKDKSFYPTKEEIIEFLTPTCVKRLSGTNSNHRLFRVELCGKIGVAHPPRANVDLIGPLLNDEKLVLQAQHQFLCFRAYRCLAPQFVPRCALYNAMYIE